MFLVLIDCIGQSAEAEILIASLRDVIRQQGDEIDQLQKKLKSNTSSNNDNVRRDVVVYFLTYLTQIHRRQNLSIFRNKWTR